MIRVASCRDETGMRRAETVSARPTTSSSLGIRPRMAATPSRSRADSAIASRLSAEWTALALPLLLLLLLPPPRPLLAVAGGALLMCLYYLEKQLLAKAPSYYNCFRVGANPGTWCSMLVVLAVGLSFPDTWTTLSDRHQLLVLQAWTTSVVSLLLVSIFVTGDGSHCRAWALGVVGIVTTVLATLASQTLRADYATVLFVSVLTQLSYCWLVSTLPTACPKSFTMGECLALSQAAVFFTLHAGMEYAEAYVGSFEAVPIHQQATRFAQVALVGCELAILLWTVFPSLRKPAGFYVTCVGVAVVFILPGMHVVLNQNPFVWFWNYAALNVRRGILLFGWFASSALIVLSSIKYGSSGLEASTVHRKLFHGALLIIYLPALVVDPEFLRLCSMVTFGLFTIAECIRIMRVPPLGDLLRRSLRGFLDEKDQGLLVVSHLCLLVGCSFPLWLNPVPDGSELKAVAWTGIISVGVGDAVASVAGTAYGRHKLPGTQKTVEGTLMSMTSQFLMVAVLLKTGLFAFPPNLLVPLVAIVSGTLLEAFTLQIDNIVIPLFMYIAWSII